MAFSFLANPGVVGAGINLTNNLLGGGQNAQQAQFNQNQITSNVLGGRALESNATALAYGVRNNLVTNRAALAQQLGYSADVTRLGLTAAGQLDILNNAVNEAAAGRNLTNATTSALFNAGIGTQQNINNTALGLQGLTGNIIGTTAGSTAQLLNNLYGQTTGANIQSSLADQGYLQNLGVINQNVQAQTQNTRTGAQATASQIQNTFNSSLGLSDAAQRNRSVEQFGNQLGGSYQTKASTEGTIAAGDAQLLQGLQRDAAGGELANLNNQRAAELAQVQARLNTESQIAGRAAESRAQTRLINDQANAAERALANQSQLQTKNLSDQGRLAAQNTELQSAARTRELSDQAGVRTTEIGNLSASNTRAVNDQILANVIGSNTDLQNYRQKLEDRIAGEGIQNQNAALLNEQNTFQSGVQGLAQTAGNSVASTRNYQDTIGATSAQQAGQSAADTRRIEDQTQSNLAGLAGGNQAAIRILAEERKKSGSQIADESLASSRRIADQSNANIAGIAASDIASRAKQEEGFAGQRSLIADQSTAKTRETADLTRGALAQLGGQSELSTRQIGDTTRGNVRTIADQTISRTQQTGDTAQASAIQLLGGARGAARQIEDQSSASSRRIADESKAKTREIFDDTQRQLAVQKALGERNIAEIDAQAYAADWGRRQGFNRALAGAALFS